MPPRVSVVIPVRGGRRRIDTPLGALEQQIDAPSFEVIVVDSGDDGCGEYVHHRYPWARVCSSSRPLAPGPARNRGIQEARGGVITFLPDDAQPGRRWVSERFKLHQRGYDCVGGAVASAGGNAIAVAEHFLEYSTVLPIQSLLDRQRIPHTLSYRRDVFDRLGAYPEDTLTGEDTLFNLKCVLADMTFAYSSEIVIRHQGSNDLRSFLRHARKHGRGLIQCATRHECATREELRSPIARDATRTGAAVQVLGRYPLGMCALTLLRLCRHAPALVPLFVLLMPLVWLGHFAAGSGALREWTQSSRTGSNQRRRAEPRRGEGSPPGAYHPPDR